MSQREAILQSKLLFQRSETPSSDTPSSKTPSDTPAKTISEKLTNSISDSEAELTNELVKKASILKNNSLNFSHVLKSDQTLDNLATKLETESIRLKKESFQISSLTSSSWITTLLIWGSVIVVVIAFIMTFIFMRLFRVDK